MATIILAGGLSTRMGREKASLALGGSTLLQALVNRFAGEMGPVIVVARQGQDRRVEQAIVVRDVYPDKGPLGGLHAGLLASPDEGNFILACDMPFANPVVARYLLDRLDGRDAVVPVAKRGLEPLHAAYGRSCLPVIEDNIRADVLRVSDLLDRTDTLYVGEEDLQSLDPDLSSFVNINSREDYEKLSFPSQG